MSLGFLVTKLVEQLLLPPGVLILLAAVGGLIARRYRRTGIGFIVAAVCALSVLSMPVVGKVLLRSLEVDSPLNAKTLARGPGAIVVLAADRYTGAPEFGGDRTNGAALERLRYAVWLHKRTGLPILVSGGAPFAEALPESEIMADSLVQDFGVTPKWLERESRTTRENARYTKTILAAAGIEHIYLVTHAWHMSRAVAVFRRSGVTVTPAPTMFTTPGIADGGILGYLPSARGLYLSGVALHEYLGQVWYGLDS